MFINEQLRAERDGQPLTCSRQESLVQRQNHVTVVPCSLYCVAKIQRGGKVNGNQPRHIVTLWLFRGP